MILNRGPGSGDVDSISRGVTGVGLLKLSRSSG
jgi:hypothetical protein